LNIFPTVSFLSVRLISSTCYLVSPLKEYLLYTIQHKVTLTTSISFAHLSLLGNYFGWVDEITGRLLTFAPIGYIYSLTLDLSRNIFLSLAHWLEIVENRGITPNLPPFLIFLRSVYQACIIKLFTLVKICCIVS
jgi:hypothetical protein